MYSTVAPKAIRTILGTPFLALCMVLCASYALAQDTITVYFVPFEIETYVPITPDTIVSKAWERWTLAGKRENSRLLRVLSRGHSATYDGKRTRLLIVAGERSYYVDSSGVVHTHGRHDVQVENAALIEFRDSLLPEQRKILHER